MDQKLHFSVDSALLRELGEKLVETVHLALSELVKNAYDADATKVRITFEEDSFGKTKLIIEDNGIGMNFHDVENYWMRIATANKVLKNVSAVYGRHLTGAKGIGRFSCRRLGDKLTLITVGTENGSSTGKQKNVQVTKVAFPWTDFEAGIDVTSISCPGTQKTLSEGETGTKLVIEDIAEEWNQQGLNWLKRQLAVLSANRGANRKGFREDPGFSVYLEAPNFEGGIRDIRDDFINAGWGTLKAFINKRNQAVCELNALGIGKKRIISSIKFPELQDISLEVGIMVDARDQMRDKTVLSKGTLAEILPKWGGVQVKYRGFRVYPYGEDDWLKIDHDRGLRKGTPKNELLVFAESLRGVDASRALLNMLSSRSYIGSVEIGPDSKGFEMKTNREGFIESQAVHQLRDFARFAIDWTTILRDYHLREETQKQALIAKENFEKVIDEKLDTGNVVPAAVGYIKQEIKTVARALKPNERRKVEQTLQKATDAILKYNESTRSELSHLRLIASTSTLLLIFSHEVKSLLGLLAESRSSLSHIAKTLKGTQKVEVERCAKQFSSLGERLEELLQLTSLVGKDQSNNNTSRVALKPKLKKVEKVFSLILNKYNISVDYSHVQPNIVFKKLLEAELYSILLNIFSNSIKATIASGGTKKIEFSSKIEKGQVVLLIKDTGIGLSSDQYEYVFTPFVSDPDGKLYSNLDTRLNPEDNFIVGSGTGLGLGIIKEIVNAHGGSIKFNPPTEDWATILEIRLK